MELKNANFNGFNVVINNLHPTVVFFKELLKIDLNKGIQSYFRIEIL